jgi:PPOX class probable F420-dependent enzyme
MSPAEARARFAVARVTRLATADAAGRPHLVPVAFALEGDTIYSAVDGKPKRTRALRRLANVRENPAVSLLVDHWDEEDWSRLWWVRADGAARVLDPSEPEARRAIVLLTERYPRQRDAGEVIVIDVARWSGWSASGD